MNVQPTGIDGVLIVEPHVFSDGRGFLFESFNAEAMSAIGIKHQFVQENHSRSRRNVLRGLHYQIRQPQGKLVRVVWGDVFDVVLDLRKSSRTFGKWVGTHLSEGNKRILWIPPGCAHGFLALSDAADVLYKATDFYAPAWERTILWNDPAIAIDWPLVGEPILSSKDRLGVPLRMAEVLD